MAAMLEEFNIIRHRFVATMLVSSATIVDEYHKQHYYMPSRSTAAIGCYLCDPDEDVPVFSTAGQPIAMFRPSAGGRNRVTLSSGDQKLIVPHGWGMAAKEPLVVAIGPKHMTFNGAALPLRPGTSLLDHPVVTPRLFSGGNREFFDAIRDHTPGDIVYELEQIASYTRHGYRRHALADISS